MRIVGYLDRISYRPGETIDLHVSSVAGAYRSDIVELTGIAASASQVAHTEVPVDDVQPLELPGREQRLPLGSYVIVPDNDALRLAGPFSIRVWVRPTKIGAPQGLISKMTPRRDAGYSVEMDRDGSARFLWAGVDGLHSVTAGAPMRQGDWYLVVATHDPDTGYSSIAQIPHRRWPGDPSRAQRTATTHRSSPLPSQLPLLMAASWCPTSDRAPGRFFNGRLEAPTIEGRVRDAVDSESLVAEIADGSRSDVAASWDFSKGISTDRVHDRGSRRMHGMTMNMPTRGVLGHAWDGRSTDWRADPAQYAAIHFHEDDLDNARWEVAARIPLPATLRSGIYAVRVAAVDAEDRIPFVVSPRPGDHTAPMLFLLPSNTYLAYGNQHGEQWQVIAARGWQSWPRPYPQGAELRYAVDHGLRSLYDTHEDGSGVCYATWRRPITNVRPNVNDEPSPDGLGFPHGLRADLQVAGWLRENRYKFDVTTDGDLDREGSHLLAPYRMIMTGTHPEYWSERMLDAVEGYLTSGGRAVYLGGNGMYWVTSYRADRPDVIEVRRWGGTPPWVAEPGEYHHSTTGELGGLWRERGRPPQRLFGVGFAAQGSAPARPYRRTQASTDARASWIFEGLAIDEPIGVNGIVMGGAGGLEFDRADVRLGTPAHALVVATATGFSNAYQLASEDLTITEPRESGVDDPRLRADMVYFETPNGGAVFATGSIAFGGTLGVDGPASRVLRNVLDGFLLPKLPA